MHRLNLQATLRDAVRQIEESQRRIAAVTDENGRLLGTVTDGDVRRCILLGGDLDSPISDAMNAEPLTVPEDTPDDEILAMLRARAVEAVPVLDGDSRLLDIVHIQDLLPESRESGGAERFAAAIIMAGGEGRRLRPLTETIPKPMVELGGMPLIERHVRRIARAGIGRTFISVNYLAHVIESYFETAGPFETQIEFLREKDKMGTAGALSLLPPLDDGPLLVLNSDVVHAADYANLLAFHEEQGGGLTVAAVEHHVQIPYGVIRADGSRLVSLEEKPSQRFLCNAGIYALEPEARAFIGETRTVDMTDVIGEMRQAGLPVAVFPIHEYWADIGDPDDLARVRNEIWKLDGKS